MRIDIHHHLEMNNEVYIHFKVLSRKLDLVINKLERLESIVMATKEEVLADLEGMRTEVEETRGAADSAVLYIKQLLDLIANAAASATDLDDFRTKLADLKAANQATEDALKAAINTNPTPTPTA